MTPSLVSAPLYVALLHYPIQNRRGELVTTSVTNMDIHDISRSAKTYGAKGYFLVTPLEEQKELVGRILNHWKSESSQAYHPDRVEAVSLVEVLSDFQEVKREIEKRHQKKPLVVLTDARANPRNVSYSQLREEITMLDQPVLLVFGTGWGISDTFFPEVDRFLAPIYGPEGAEGYNHLSVRAAVAAILDRLFGR